MTVERVPLRIAIADDHALFRKGLRSLLKLQVDLAVVAEIERVEDIAPALERTPCDILLLYLAAEPNLLSHIIRSVGGRTAVIVITTGEPLEDALTALRWGARAVVFKRLAIDALVEAIAAVAVGHVWIPPALQAHVVGRLQEPLPTPLTSREREITCCVGRGMRNLEVARKLCISEQTVKTHLNNIFRKLVVRDRVELALYAARIGLIGVHEQRESTGPTQSAA